MDMDGWIWMDKPQWRRKVFQDEGGGGQTKSRRPITRGASPPKKRTFKGDITGKIVACCRKPY